MFSSLKNMVIQNDREDNKRTYVVFLFGLFFLFLSYIERKGKLFPIPFDMSWLTVIFCAAEILSRTKRKPYVVYKLIYLSGFVVISVHDPFIAGIIAMIILLLSYSAENTLAFSENTLDLFAKRVPQSVRVIKDGRAFYLPLDGIRTGDVIRVLPGEVIPLDGSELKTNRKIFSGSVNYQDAFEMYVEIESFSSSLQRAVRLMRSIDVGAVSAVKSSRRLADGTALILFLASAAISIFSGDMVRGAAALLSFTAYPMVVSIYAAVSAAAGSAAEKGIIIWRTAAFERLMKGKDRIVRSESISDLDMSRMPDIILMDNTPLDIGYLRALAKKTSFRIRIILAVCLAVFVLLAVFSVSGILSAAISVLINALISVAVMVYSAQPYKGLFYDYHDAASPFSAMRTDPEPEKS